MASQPRNEKICLIYAVSYGQDKKRIAKVKAQISTGPEPEPIKIYTKAQILSFVDDGFSVITMVAKGKDFKVGADVFDYTINRTRFLKTVSNDREEDNLGELPTF